MVVNVAVVNGFPDDPPGKNIILAIAELLSEPCKDPSWLVNVIST
jgi:hypothetical protein